MQKMIDNLAVQVQSPTHEQVGNHQGISPQNGIARGEG